MKWADKTVLVTGAGGFIGSHLTEALVQLGANVRAFVHYNAVGRWGWLDQSDDKTQIEIIAGDICDRESVHHAMKGVDIAFHLAALIAIPYSYRAPHSYVRTNIEGALNILQNARDMDIERIIHTSTSEVYGTARKVPIAETHPLQAQSPYAASKIAADKLAESFHLSFGLPVVTVRPFNTYGPRQSARAVIPSIIAQCLAQQPIKLGNLHPTRDFNYVSDTVRGFICAAETETAIGQTFNIGSGREISIGDLADAIIRLTGTSRQPETDHQRLRPATSEVERLLADNTLARQHLNWQPQISLEDGLQKTIFWLQNNLAQYRPETYGV